LAEAVLADAAETPPGGGSWVRGSRVFRQGGLLFLIRPFLVFHFIFLFFMVVFGDRSVLPVL